MIFSNWWIQRKQRKQQKQEQEALARHFDTHEEFMKDNNGRRVKSHKDQK